MPAATPITDPPPVSPPASPPPPPAVTVRGPVLAATEVQGRRLAALTTAMREVGYTGTGGFDPATNTVTLDTPHAQAQALARSWVWTEAAPPPTLDAVAADAAAAKAAANQAMAATFPYWAGQVTTGADGKFSVDLPAGLFAVGTIPVVLGSCQPTANTTRPHTFNLLAVSATQVTGYVSYIRPLPSGLLNALAVTIGAALNAYDPSQPAAGCIVHVRAGYPKT